MLAASPGTVWEDIEKEFAILITKDGRPHSIIILTSVETRIEDVSVSGNPVAKRFWRFCISRSTSRRRPGYIRRPPPDEDDTKFLEVALQAPARTVVIQRVAPSQHIV